MSVTERDKWDAYFASQPVQAEDPAVREFNDEFARHMLELLPNGGSILEIGSGPGYQSLALARTGKFSVTLMDFAPHALEHARALFSMHDMRAEFVLGDAFEEGAREYDLVFNAGALEHYAFDMQVAFMRGMASRSRRFVLALVPNSQCYWYWIHRIRTAASGRWEAGRESPLTDLMPMFREAGIAPLGNAYMGRKWTEVFIENLTDVPEATRQELLLINRTQGLVSDAVASYLLAGLGTTAMRQEVLPRIWIQPDQAVDPIRADPFLQGELADALALNVSLERQVQSTNHQLESQSRQLESLTEQIETHNQQTQALSGDIRFMASQVTERDSTIEQLVSRLQSLDRVIAARAEEVRKREETITALATVLESSGKFKPNRAKKARRRSLPKPRTISAPLRLPYKVVRKMYRMTLPHDLRMKLYLRRHAGDVDKMWSDTKPKAWYTYSELPTPEAVARAVINSTAAVSTTTAGGALAEGVTPVSLAKSSTPAPLAIPTVLRKRKRVAYLTNMVLNWQTGEPSHGGGERYCATLSRLLEEHGLDVTIFQPASRAFESEYYGIPVKTLPFGPSEAEFAYGVCDEFTRVTAEYDHVIHNLPEYSSGKVRDDAIIICHGLWFDHNNYPGVVFRTEEWFKHLHRAFSQGARVVSVDTNSINFIRALYPDAAQRMRYIPNWVDTTTFTPSDDRDPDSKVVLFPRRAAINRGSRLVGPILERISHNWEFWWVGAGDEPENKVLADLASHDPRLRFVTTDFDGMVDYYRKAQIAVIPTIGSEGTSLSCIEALASGCAVVSTNVGGLTDVIVPGMNGLLTDPDEDSIAAAINKLIEDPAERARLQVAGLRSSKYFDADHWRQRWIQVLTSAGWIE